MVTGLVVVPQEHWFGFNQSGPSIGMAWRRDAHLRRCRAEDAFCVSGILKRVSQSWNEASGALAGAGWLSGVLLRGACKSRQGTKDCDSLYVSDFKLVCLERWFARLRCSSQNVRGPADWPALGFPTSTCTCISVSTGKVSGSEMEREEQKMSFSCNVLSSNFALHKYVSSSLDSPGI